MTRSNPRGEDSVAIYQVASSWVAAGGGPRDCWYLQRKANGKQTGNQDMLYTLDFDYEHLKPPKTPMTYIKRKVVLVTILQGKLSFILFGGACEKIDFTLWGSESGPRRIFHIFPMQNTDALPAELSCHTIGIVFQFTFFLHDPSEVLLTPWNTWKYEIQNTVYIYGNTRTSHELRFVMSELINCLNDLRILAVKKPGDPNDS